MKVLVLLFLVAGYYATIMWGYSIQKEQILRLQEMSTVSYKEQILPIVIKNCSMCHNQGTPDRNWLDYNTTYKKRENIKLRLENRSMPVGIKMLESDRELMIEWVNEGAKP